MTTKQCVFCGRSDQAFDIEDVIPQWISRRAQKEKLGMWTERRDGKGRQYQAIRYEIDTVCKPCNNVWLSLLEKRAEKVLSPLMFGRRGVALSADDQELIARWAFKTMLTFDQMEEPDTPRWIAPWVYRNFFDSDMQLPKDSAVVWTGDVGPEKGGQALIHPVVLRIPPRDGDPILAATMSPGALFTLRVGHFVARVLWAELAGRLREPEEAQGKLVRLWPEPAPSMTWPPPIPLTQRELDELSIRHVGRPIVAKRLRPMTVTEARRANRGKRGSP